MNDMIDALTMGIGAELGRPIRIQFFNQRKMLESNPTYQELRKNRKRLAIDILAMSIFHSQVILPLHGSANFLSRTRRYGVTRIRLGSSHFTREDALQSGRITKQFFALVTNYGFEIAQLTFTSPSDLVAIARDFGRSDG